jgi:hypothetical protein
MPLDRAAASRSDDHMGAIRNRDGSGIRFPRGPIAAASRSHKSASDLSSRRYSQLGPPTAYTDELIFSE